MRGCLLIALLALPAVAQEPGDSVVQVWVPEPEVAHTVYLRNNAGTLAELAVPDPCIRPCVLTFILPVPDGPIWAVSANDAGESERSNVGEGDSYLTIWDRADLDRDGRPTVRDLLILNRMLFEESPR